MVMMKYSCEPPPCQRARGKKTGPVGDPVSFGRVQTRALSGTHASCGKIREGKTAGGVASGGAAGPGYLWYSFFVRKWREGGLSQYKKEALHSGKSAHVREVRSEPPSSPAGLCLPPAPGVDQQLGGSAASCSVCSAETRGGAAGPGSQIGNHRCRLGWEGAAKSGGSGVGFLFRRFAGAASADAVSSGGVGGRLGQSVRVVSATAVALAGHAGRW